MSFSIGCQFKFDKCDSYEMTFLEIILQGVEEEKRVLKGLKSPKLDCCLAWHGQLWFLNAGTISTKSLEGPVKNPANIRYFFPLRIFASCITFPKGPTRPLIRPYYNWVIYQFLHSAEGNLFQLCIIFFLKNSSALWICYSFFDAFTTVWVCTCTRKILWLRLHSFTTDHKMSPSFSTRS